MVKIYHMFFACVGVVLVHVQVFSIRKISSRSADITVKSYVSDDVFLMTRTSVDGHVRLEDDVTH